MPTERLFCSECGAANEADAAFCESCGHRLEAAADSAVAAPAADEPAAAPARGSRLKLLAIPIVLIAAAGGAWALGAPMPAFLSKVGITTRGVSADSVQLAPAATNVALNDRPAPPDSQAPVLDVVPPVNATAGGAPAIALLPQPTPQAAPAAPPPSPPRQASAASQQRPQGSSSSQSSRPPSLPTSVASFPDDFKPPTSMPTAAPQPATPQVGSTAVPSGSDAASTAPARPAPRIPSGVVLALRSSDQICTDKTRQGAKFTAVVQQDVQGANGATIPRGTTVTFVVDRLKRATQTEKAEFSIAPESIQLEGESHELAASVDAVAIKEKSRGLMGALAGAATAAVVTRAAGGDTKQTVAGGVLGGAAGAVIGNQLKTGDGCIEKNAAIRLTLTSDITL